MKIAFVIASSHNDIYDGFKKIWIKNINTFVEKLEISEKVFRKNKLK